MFVDGAENITILKGEYEKINYDAPKFVVLHPGWNNLDMNGELKDGFVISDGDDSQKLARIKQIDFSKFTGKRLGSFMISKTGVEELILPDTIEEIGEGCFYGNLLLKKIILPKKIKKIPALLFNSCMSLKEVNLHEGILSIGQSSFTSVSIKTFIIPSTVKKIEDSFYMYLSNGDVIENGSVRFQSITPPEFTNHIFDEIDRIEVPMSAVETYKNLNIPGWKEKFGDKIVGY